MFRIYFQRYSNETLLPFIFYNYFNTRIVIAWKLRFQHEQRVIMYAQIDGHFFKYMCHYNRNIAGRPGPLYTCIS